MDFIGTATRTSDSISPAGSPPPSASSPPRPLDDSKPSFKPSPSTRICIVGASGFIGKNLIHQLKNQTGMQVRGLARSFNPRQDGNIEYRPFDLFSLLETEQALEGQQIGVYLVHSMLPSSLLAQGNFQDYDLILADNFVRAAKKAKLKRIIYLGGIIPEDQNNLSEHLKSRLEVEECLRSSNIPVTTLRAGLITGPGGSSFTMVVRLVQRLPLMICPAWTSTRSSPIHIDDVIASILYCIADPEGRSENNPIYDIGGQQETTYLKIMQKTAEILGKRRFFIHVNMLSPRFSRLWVRTFTGAPKQLVYPLIDSLLHEMKLNPARVLLLPNHHYKSYLDSLVEVSHPNPNPDSEPSSSKRSREQTTGGSNSSNYVQPTAYERPRRAGPEIVQSVQRVTLPKEKSAEWVSLEYGRWLKTFFRFFISVKQTGEDLIFEVSPSLPPLLSLHRSLERSTPDRVLFYITGGILVKNTKKGRLEFRESYSKKHVIIAIHDFQPRLPWFIYKYTQAPIHLWVMKKFGKHLDFISKSNLHHKNEH